jgi:hypothetical protein
MGRCFGLVRDAACGAVALHVLEREFLELDALHLRQALGDRI